MAAARLACGYWGGQQPGPMAPSPFQRLKALDPGLALDTVLAVRRRGGGHWDQGQRHTLAPWLR